MTIENEPQIPLYETFEHRLAQGDAGVYELLEQKKAADEALRDTSIEKARPELVQLSKLLAASLVHYAPEDALRVMTTVHHALHFGLLVGVMCSPDSSQLKIGLDKLIVEDDSLDSASLHLRNLAEEYMSTRPNTAQLIETYAPYIAQDPELVEPVTTVAAISLSATEVIPREEFLLERAASISAELNGGVPEDF